jgi:DNA-binding transcriptional ArsR family regulator
VTLTATFSALSDPTRRAILDQLGRGPASVSDLAKPHPMSLPAVTKHLGVLEAAGLVVRRKTGRTVMCTLNPRPIAEAASWLTDRESFWTASLDRLESLITKENPT